MVTMDPIIAIYLRDTLKLWKSDTQVKETFAKTMFNKKFGELRSGERDNVLQEIGRFNFPEA